MSIEVARSRLGDLKLDDGVEKSKVDSVRSRLFGVLRPYYDGPLMTQCGSGSFILQT